MVFYRRTQISKIEDLELSEFVVEDSWSFFHILKLDNKLWNLPFEEWQSVPQFKADKEIISNLSVINN